MSYLYEVRKREKTQSEKQLRGAVLPLPQIVPSICSLVLGISAKDWFLSVEVTLLILDLIAI